eukprot:1146935-Pelagomonas_calceolata.AAC.4
MDQLENYGSTRKGIRPAQNLHAHAMQFAYKVISTRNAIENKITRGGQLRPKIRCFLHAPLHRCAVTGSYGAHTYLATA